MAEKRYYWLRLKNDFFKRHDIKIIEDMPNGKDYILFYLKLLVESVSHDGELRFSDTIPYNEQMLSTITNTNIDIVRSAMKIFIELKMVEILEDSTIYMREVEKMVGCETKWAEKKRLQRSKKKDNVLTLSPPCPLDVRQEKEKEIELELDKEIDTSISGVVDFFEENIGTMSKSILTDMNYYLKKGIEDKLIITCLRIAVDNNKRNWSYARGIIRNLINKGIQTQKQYDAMEVERENERICSNGRKDLPTTRLTGGLDL